MFKTILSLFSTDPIKKLSKEKERKYKLAVSLQRNGNLREYASAMKEIELIEEQILKLHRKND